MMSKHYLFQFTVLVVYIHLASPVTISSRDCGLGRQNPRKGKEISAPTLAAVARMLQRPSNSSDPTDTETCWFGLEELKPERRRLNGGGMIFPRSGPSTTGATFSDPPV